MTPADAQRLLDAVREAEYEARHDRGRYNSGNRGNSEYRRDRARQALASEAGALALGLVAAGEEIARLRKELQRATAGSEVSDG